MSAVALLRRQPAARAADDEHLRSPLRLWSAIRLALAFQISLMAIALVRDTLGNPGVLASAALLGLTDMDALTLSMNRLGTTTELVQLAARAIAIGVIANAILKLGLVVVLGVARFRRFAAIGLASLAAVSAAALWMWW
jgi:uncharacterized membrane protein (DUF4010 family)